MLQRVRRPWPLHWTAVCLLLLAGCPSSKPVAEKTGKAKNVAAKSKADPPSGPRMRPVSELVVKVADYLPPLDEGRIEIARPAGWEVGARQIGYVAWFHRYKDTQALPHIRITVENTPPDAPPDVTRENVEQFAKWLAGYVKQNLNKDEKLIEPVVPMIVGDNAVGRYVRKGRYRGADAEQHMLVTSHGGRLYTLQQLVLKGDLEKKHDIRDAAYAVAASFKFHAAGTTPSPDTNFQTPSEAPPAP